MAILLKDLNLSVRVYNCLVVNEGLTTLEEVSAKLSEPELMRIPNFGKQSLKEVKEILKEHGLSLISNDEYWVRWRKIVGTNK